MTAENETERIRYVQWAADCAERVLAVEDWFWGRLMESAIRHARAWTTCPCERHRIVAALTSHNLFEVDAGRFSGFRGTGPSPYAAVSACANAASATYVDNYDTVANKAASDAVQVARDKSAEKNWQEERRKHYGLPEPQHPIVEPGAKTLRDPPPRW
jgi:hypothetical protein